MAEELTLQQRAAVENRGGKLLVSAAAGSGKTKVLVDRLLGYLNDPANPANLDEFLIITYTKAAASELRGKIAAKLTEKIAEQPENRHLQRQMQRLFLTKISTVHGFCADILREYAYRLDLSADFRVADENECREIRESVLSELLDRAYAQAGADADFRAFVDTQGLGRDDRLVAEIILKVYDSARCHLDPEGWLQGCLDAVDMDGVTDAGQTLWGSYLMQEFFSYLDCQIGVMERCVELAACSDGMDKPAANLRNTLNQLRTLRQATGWDAILEAKNLDYGRLTFPRKGIDTELAEQIKACRNACKKGIEKQLRGFSDPSAQVLEDLQGSAAGVRGLIALVRQFGAAYDSAKRSRRVLDFGDLEHRTLDLVLGKSRTSPTAAAREIGQRFREIMVDEYQDSNGVQDAIFDALTGQRQNLFMVGDVKQSIYQFRLADPGIFLEKYHRYRDADSAKPGEGRKVLLSANFRSGCEVIEAVNDVFTTCMSPAVGGLHYGEAEMLSEGVPKGSLPEPGVELYGVEVSEDTYGEEAAFVAQRIRELLDGTHMIRDKKEMCPITAGDIVILLRSPGSVGVRYQDALRAQGIRCTSGGGTDLLQTEEIGTLRSILQTVANPRQDIPLISALASPVFGFTADDLASFRGRQKRGTVYDALCGTEHEKGKNFLQMLEKLRKCARMHTIARLIEEIFCLTRMDSIYAAMPGGESRSANLQLFYSLAVDYEAASGKDLAQFLEYLDAMEEKGLKTEGEDAGGAVTIMSIHKSKGLEFPVVFLCGLSREFNREDQRAQVLCDKELGLGLSVADTVNRVRYPAISKRAIIAKTAAESISEEMRVLYVAMTRAKDRLVMTYASRNLADELQDIAMRYDIGGGELLTRDVVCPGEWVLMSALLRMEAGQFHNLGTRPAKLRISERPWLIRVVEKPEEQAGEVCPEADQDRLPDGIRERLMTSLDFSYAHMAATAAPSKQTATQRKNRPKDEEAAQQAVQPKQTVRQFRRPAFAGGAAAGTAYGNAVHTAMQYIRYEGCMDAAKVREEIQRMIDAGILTEKEAGMIDCKAIARFFSSEIGRKLCGGTEYIREFKFSVLDDGSHYRQDLLGEQVLLQGVVDCALLEADGITVLDFKTDYVTEESLPGLLDRYRPQVQTYAHALSRIFGRQIKASYLYFFRLNRFVAV